MVRSQPSQSKIVAVQRDRLGRVSVYEHHGVWWIYAQVNGRSVRRRIGSHAATECAASLLNARLVAEEAGLSAEAVGEQLGGLLGAWRPGQIAPAGLPLAPSIDPAELRRRFLDHHEQVLDSALATIRRYATATQHLIDFASAQAIDDAMALDIAVFIAHLRQLEVAPNGHRYTPKRKLRDKGIKYILETCRSMYRFGQHQNLLPTDRPNPFSAFGLGKLQVRERADLQRVNSGGKAWRDIWIETTPHYSLMHHVPALHAPLGLILLVTTR